MEQDLLKLGRGIHKWQIIGAVEVISIGEMLT